jgi:hypothetical protein
MIGVLLGTELQRLRDALEAALPDEVVLTPFVRYTFGTELNLVAPIGGSYRATTDAFVRWIAVSTERVRVLVERVSEAHTTPTPMVAFKTECLPAVLARRPTPWYGTADHFEAVFVRGGQPFLDRRSLRQHLRALATPGGARILAVGGPPRSGKTYTIELISYLADVQATAGDKFNILWVDLDDEATFLLSPGDLASAIVDKLPMRVEARPPKSDRWVPELRDWIVREVKRSGGTWWLVLDNFHHPDLPQDTRSLIGQLMVQADRAVPELRVVMLTHTPELLPAKLAGRILTEQTASVGPPELTAFFTQLVRDGVFDATPGAIDQAVRTVLQDAGTPPDLAVVAREAARVVGAFRAATPGAGV